MGDDGWISIAIDNTDGTAGSYPNFFSAANPNIVSGNTYEVSYEIDVSSVTGTVGVFISSQGTSNYDAGMYQLGEQDIYTYISTAETITGSYTVHAVAGAEELSRMLRSYLYVPSGAALECKMHITVTELETHMSAVVNGQTVNSQRADSGEYLFLPASADFTELTLVSSYDLKSEDGTDIIELSEDGTAVDLTALTGGEMSAGVEYTFELTDEQGETVTELVIMKADNISSIFVISDKTVEELNTNKSVTGTGTATMITADGTQVNSDTAMKKIKGRGNSSWYYSGEKRPYNLNLNKKAELIEGAGSAKKWCLISDNCTGSWVYEAAGLANAAALDIYKGLGGAYPIECKFVNLYINNEYRGVYLLTEKVEINDTRVNVTESTYAVEDESSTTLVITEDELVNTPERWSNLSTSNANYLSDSEDDILASGIQAYSYATNSELAEGTESGGFLLELDRDFYAEASWFVTSNGTPYVVKEPEFATREQVAMIAKYIQAYEDALFSESGYSNGTYYADYIDMDSYAAKLLTDFVTRQTDTFATSTFFSIDYVNGELGKIVAGLAWDYDGSNYAWDGMITYNVISQNAVKKLFSHGDFAAAAAEMSEGVLKEVWQEEQASLTEYVEDITNSYNMNRIIWNENLRPYEFSTFITNFTKRYNKWYASYYDDSKLLGVTIAMGDDGIITATAAGTASAYQWMKLDSDNVTLSEIDGETASTYEPTEDGVYYCKASGTSISELFITEMYSNPVIIGEAPTPSPTPTPVVKYAINAAAGDDGTIVFDFTTAQTADAYVAEYNEYGELVSLQKQALDTDGEISVAYSANSSYKAFLWSTNGTPLCSAAEYSL